MNLIHENVNLNQILRTRVILASFRFIRRMVLRRLKCQFYSCVHASNLLAVGPPN